MLRALRSSRDFRLLAAGEFVSRAGTAASFVAVWLLVLATLILGACGAGAKEIDEAEIEDQIASQLAAEVDQPKPDIDCPGPLRAKVGATAECVLSVKGDDKRFPVRVEVTAVKDGKASFDTKVGTEPLQ